MCFIIDTKHPNVKIAKKNIPCYKILRTDGNETFSPFMNMLYHTDLSSGKDVKLTVENFSFDQLDYIHEGLHSFSNKKWLNGHNLFIAYIPKGTKYYYDSVNSEYISLAIVVTTKTVR